MKARYDSGWCSYCRLDICEGDESVKVRGRWQHAHHAPRGRLSRYPVDHPAPSRERAVTPACQRHGCAEPATHWLTDGEDVGLYRCRDHAPLDDPRWTAVEVS